MKGNTKQLTPNPLPSDSNIIKVKEMRKLNINQSQTHRFKNNEIKTAKYNIFSFLPHAIILQFNNYFNCFFLFTAVVTAIPQISPLTPSTAVAPFIFVIIVSLIREAVEDYKKAQYDKTYNNSNALRYDSTSSTFQATKWKELNVGDIIKVNKNDIIPCDILIIKSSAENGFCYLETTNLDGESALKPRESLLVTNTFINSDTDFNSIKGLVEIDPPNNDIYSIEGTIFLENYEKCYFDINNILLRGGRLKNVESGYGIVVYTGKDTKIMKNINHSSLKQSNLDKKLNTIVIYILLIVFGICILTTILGAFFRKENLPVYHMFELNADYMLYFRHDNTFLNPTEGRNDVLEIIRIFTGLFIIFNTLIPISIIITITIVKGFQVVFIENDPELAKDPEDKVKILSMQLLEDLGSVKYIFSDKTGTLTRNEMEFKACSIFTRLFDDEEEKEDSNKGTSDWNTVTMTQTKIKTSTGKSKFAKSFDKNALLDMIYNSIGSNIDHCPYHLYKNEMVEFFLSIALNHNVLTETDSKTGNTTFQGANPDEVTLVTSVSELGIEFLDRQNKFIRVKIGDTIETFEILYKFDFTSARMRSSIVVKDRNNIVKLYMKGADTVVLKKLDAYSFDHFLVKTKEHMDSFAKRGLRTLCYSFKELDPVLLREWERKYSEIKYRAINDKSLNKYVEETISKLETDLMLMGVTALEDKLQDNVKNDLQEFIDAGINVWMITGDKMDTAESIGHSCRLFNDDTEVFKIRSGNKESTIQRMREILDNMKILEKEVEQLREKSIKKEIEQIIAPSEPNREHKETFKETEEDGLFRRTVRRNRSEKDVVTFSPHALDYMNNGTKSHRTRDSRQSTARNQKLKLKPQFSSLTKMPPCDADEPLDNIQTDSNRSVQNSFDMKENRMANLIQRESNSVNPIARLNQARHRASSFKDLLSSHVFNKKTKVNEKDKDKEEEINDASIMNYMVAKNFFETSNDNMNNFTFINAFGRKKEVDNSINIAPQKKNEDEFLRDQSQDEFDRIYNEVNRNPTKQDKLQDNRPDLNSSAGINRNDEVDKVLTVRNINQKVKFDIPKPQKEMKSSMKRNDKRRHSHLLTSSSNKENQQILIKRDDEFLTPDNTGKKNLGDFLNYYKEKIQNYERRKKSILFDFTHKKNNDHVEAEDENQDDFKYMNFGLIIEGASISHCLDEDTSELFWKLIKKTRSLVCCRCSPIQKAEVTQFVKKKSGKITLAIGDGGNDVNMIKTANVGIGIFGKEGYQAAYNSDYAISQFKYLKRLIFNHGRYSLERDSYFIYFFFFKNVLFTIPQFLLCFFSGFSGVNYYDEWYYLGFNSFITALPVAVRAVVEEDIDIEFQGYPHRRELLKFLVPDIYKEYRDSVPFKVGKFFEVFLCAFVFAIAVFFVPFAAFSYRFQDNNGRVFSHWDASLCSYVAIIAIHFLVLFEDTHLYNWLNVTLYSFQAFIIIIFMIIHDLLDAGELSGITRDVMFNLTFWFTAILTIAVCMVPFYIYRRLDLHFSNDIINNLRQKKYEHDYARKYYMKKLEQMTKATRSIAKFKRLYKMNQDIQEVDNYADKQMKIIVDQFKNERKKFKNTVVNRPEYHNLIANFSREVVVKIRSSSFTGLKYKPKSNKGRT